MVGGHVILVTQYGMCIVSNLILTSNALTPTGCCHGYYVVLVVAMYVFVDRVGRGLMLIALEGCCVYQ